MQKTSKTAKASGGHAYVVKKGETFYSVAKRFGISPSTLAASNNISPNTKVRSGQKLVIKGGSGQMVASASPSRLIHYKIKKGDSLMQLSRKFGVSLGDLRKSNPQASKGIRPGQSIKNRCRWAAFYLKFKPDFFARLA